MDYGREIKRDVCPPKYYTGKTPIGSLIPLLLAFLLISVFTSSLFRGAGAGRTVNLLIHIVYVGGAMALFWHMQNKQRGKLSEIYISVCENGISGVTIKGNKRKPVEIPYDKIRGVSTKGDSLFLSTEDGSISFLLSDIQATSALIEEKIQK